MIEVRFFASIREQLGVDRLVLPASAGLTVLSLRDFLIEKHGDSWREILSESNVVKAVNHTVVDDQYLIADGDEVAFFPPVTGG